MVILSQTKSLKISILWIFVVWLGKKAPVIAEEVAA